MKDDGVFNCQYCVIMNLMMKLRQLIVNRIRWMMMMMMIKCKILLSLSYLKNFEF